MSQGHTVRPQQKGPRPWEVCPLKARKTRTMSVIDEGVSGKRAPPEALLDHITGLFPWPLKWRSSRLPVGVIAAGRPACPMPCYFENKGKLVL